MAEKILHLGKNMVCPRRDLDPFNPQQQKQLSKGEDYTAM